MKRFTDKQCLNLVPFGRRLLERFGDVAKYGRTNVPCCVCKEAAKVSLGMEVDDGFDRCSVCPVFGQAFKQTGATCEDYIPPRPGESANNSVVVAKVKEFGQEVVDILTKAIARGEKLQNGS